MGALSVKLKGIDWKGNVSFPSFTQSLGKLKTPTEALSKATSGMSGFIHPPGATPLTIAQTQLLGYRIDEAQMKVIVQSINIPLIGQVYDVKSGFSGLGGKLFSSLLGGNMPFLANAQSLLSTYQTLSQVMSNPGSAIDMLSGAVTNPSGDILGMVEGAQKNISIFSDPTKILDKSTGEIKQKIPSVGNTGSAWTMGKTLGHLQIDSVTKSTQEVLAGLGQGYSINTSTGAITDSVGTIVGRATQYTQGFKGIPAVEDMMKDGCTYMMNTQSGVTEEFSNKGIKELNNQIKGIRDKIGSGAISSALGEKQISDLTALSKYNPPAVRITNFEDVIESQKAYAAEASDMAINYNCDPKAALADHGEGAKKMVEYAMSSDSSSINLANTGYKKYLNEWKINAQDIPQSTHGWG